MPRAKRTDEWKALNVQISKSLYDQLKERSEIKGQTMTTTLERILTVFFSEYPNDEVRKIENVPVGETK